MKDLITPFKYSIGPLEIVQYEQGTPEWGVYRDSVYNASELCSARGVAKYGAMCIEELALQRQDVRAEEVSDYVQEFIFNPGHETEKYARIILSERINSPLAPLVGKVSCPELNRDISASTDGVTFDIRIGFEHKKYHPDIVRDIESGKLHAHYESQMDQGILVFGLERFKFVTSDTFRASPEEFMDIKHELMAYSSLQNDELGDFYACAYQFHVFDYVSDQSRFNQVVETWARYEEIESEVILQSEDWRDSAAEFLSLRNDIAEHKAAIKSLEKEQGIYKNTLTEEAFATGLNKLAGGGLAATKVAPKGQIQESALLEAGVKPEIIAKCRKEPTPYWRFSPLKPTSHPATKPKKTKAKKETEASTKKSA